MPDTGGEIGLPPLFPVRGFEGSLSEYVDCLYGEYRAMVDHAHIRLWGKPLAVWGGSAEDGRDQIFWHLVTESSKARTETSRRLNLVRCARLSLVRSMLELLATADIRVCWWRQKIRGRLCILVAPVDFTHIVVLREAPECVYLTTSYPIGRRHRQRFMERAATSWLTGQSGEWRQRSAVAEAA